MVKSMYSGVAGLRAHQTKMDVIGNNIANVNTFGFKAGRVTFKDSFYQTLSGSSTASATLGGSNAKQVGYGSQVNTIDVIYTPGGFAQTGEPGDLMIQGNGFFCVGPYDQDGLDPKDKNSVPKLNLTRVGVFRFEGTGKLADPMGNVVYGYKGISAGTNLTTLTSVAAGGKEYTTGDGYRVQMVTPGDTTTTPPTPPTFNFYDASATPPGFVPMTATTKPKLDSMYNFVTDATTTPPTLSYTLKTGLIDRDRLVPIELPYDTAKGAPLKMETISYGTNGTISGTDEYGNSITVGQVAVANVPNPSALEMQDGSYYRVRNNTGDVLVSTPGEGGTGGIMSGGLEQSNVDLSKEFSDMITTQRGFQANTRIITVSDEMLQELVNIKR